MLSSGRQPELPPKSLYEADLAALALVLHRARMNIRTEIDGEETVTSSSSRANISRFRGPNNRRRSERFPLACPISYRTLGRTCPQAEGTGRTINVSSSGILFTTEHTLEPGERVEISLAWPAKKDHQLPLELAATAKVVRCEEGKTAVETLQYEFRAPFQSSLGTPP